MVAELLDTRNMQYVFNLMTNFIKLPATKLWLDYDADADVVYLHFVEHPASTHSDMREDGIILDYQDDQLVGLTILEASHRTARKQRAS